MSTLNDLSRDIMNIQTPSEANGPQTVYSEVLSTADILMTNNPSILRAVWLAYKLGHRDARHAAADLVDQASVKAQE